MKALVTTAAAAALIAGAAYAGPSAKFAAGWKQDTVTLYKIDDVSLFGGTSVFNGESATTVGAASEKLATIKVPQGKELLIGASGVATVATFTQAKGKGGNTSNNVTTTALAEGALFLSVGVVPKGSASPCTPVATGDALAAPGEITMASRKQELAVTVNLTGSGTTISDMDLNLDVTVALGIETTGAHHFNFVAADLDSGEYDVYACWRATANAVDTTDVLTGAAVAIGKRMVTVQEVRGVKDEVIDLTSNN